MVAQPHQLPDHDDVAPEDEKPAEKTGLDEDRPLDHEPVLPDTPLPPRSSSLKDANVDGGLIAEDGEATLNTTGLADKTDLELVAQTSSLEIKPLDLSSLDAREEEQKPATPVRGRVERLSISSPPPPSPPPKDTPPRHAPNLKPPPKDVPPKDVPPKDITSSTSKRKVPEPMQLESTARGSQLYLDPPLTPIPSRPSSPMRSPTSTGKNRSQPSSDDENEPARSEIHDLFEKSHRASLTGDQLTTNQIASPTLGPSSPSHPPRQSSLSPNDLVKPTSPTLGEGPLTSPVASTQQRQQQPSVPATPVTLHSPPPPDEDLPFDFHRFLSQLRHRSADPVAKFLRSFLHEFAKKQWMVHEQVKIVRDFLSFIYGKMDQCEVWRDVGDVEMDNAQEGMEKLVMNRLYTQTFSPAIPPGDVTPRDERFPGRRGQHQEDVERDEVLTQKVRIYTWIREEHLDIGDTISGEGGRRFLDLAVKEMLKIGSYRAPRDKVICVLNCCKVIFGLLRHSKSDESADKFVPLLIYVVLRANPAHLVSNVQYILRFRNPDKLNGEAGYYLSSLMGAIQFIENLDRSSLTISPEEFEANVEAAVAAIAERPPPSPPAESEKPAAQPADSHDESSDEKAAVAGLLRTIQKPLSTIGRIFSDEPSSSLGPVSTPQPGNTPRHSPSFEGRGRDTLLTAVGGRRHNPSSNRERDRTEREQPRKRDRTPRGMSAEEAAARQASAETEEARRIGRMEYENVVEILKGMFPALDREVIGDVVRMKEGRVGLAVDACLALSAS